MMSAVNDCSPSQSSGDDYGLISHSSKGGSQVASLAFDGFEFA